MIPDDGRGTGVIDLRVLGILNSLESKGFDCYLILTNVLDSEREGREKMIERNGYGGVFIDIRRGH